MKSFVSFVLVFFIFLTASGEGLNSGEVAKVVSEVSTKTGDDPGSVQDVITDKLATGGVLITTSGTTTVYKVVKFDYKGAEFTVVLD